MDGLHQSAGAVGVIELLGGLEHVVCLACGAPETRYDLDTRLHVLNPGFATDALRINPDGDAEISDEALCRRLVMAGCCVCGSDLVKPDVVFFSVRSRAA